jgi:acyl carrier protein
MSDSVAFEPAVLRVLSETLNQPEAALQANPVLAAHAWDSLNSLNALLNLEAAFHIKFDLRRFHAARRIDDLVALVASASDGASAPAAHSSHLN